jgi:hypothetical protein
MSAVDFHKFPDAEAATLTSQANYLAVAQARLHGSLTPDDRVANDPVSGLLANRSVIYRTIIYRTMTIVIAKLRCSSSRFFNGGAQDLVCHPAPVSDLEPF